MRYVHSGEQPDVGLQRKRIGETKCDETPLSQRCIPPELKPVKINAGLPEIRVGDRLNRNVRRPEIEWVIGRPAQRGILRINSRHKAIIAVNDAYDDFKSVGCSDAWQIDAEADLDYSSSIG